MDINQLLESEETSIFVITLWDHWLTREEYNQLFPLESSLEYIEASGQIYNCFVEFVEALTPLVFQFDVEKNALDSIPKEEVLSQNKTYQPHSESSIYIDSDLKWGIQLGYDFCLRIYEFQNNKINDLDEVIKTHNLFKNFP